MNAERGEWEPDIQSSTAPTPRHTTGHLPTGGKRRTMTSIAIDEEGVDVEYQGTEFRMERSLIEEATGKDYRNVTDHEVLQLIEENPTFSREPRRIGDLL